MSIANGKTIQQIASDLGRSVPAVEYKLKKIMEFKMNRYDNEIEKVSKELHMPTEEVYRLFHLPK